MAKIEDIGAYPNQSPVTLADYLIGTDAATKATKTFTIQDIADALDEQVTLQEVLNASDPAGVPNPTAAATGNIELTGNFSLIDPTSDFNIDGGDILASSGNNLTLANKGSADDILLVAGNVSGDVKLTAGSTSGAVEGTGAALSFTMVDSVDIVGGGDVLVHANGASADLVLKGGDKSILSANGSSYGAQPAGTVMLYNQNDDIIVNASNGQITIGGTYPNRPTGLDLGPIDGDIDIWAFSVGSDINLIAQDKINITANGGIESLSAHGFAELADFKADGGMLLNGVAGTTGQVMINKGAAAPAEWGDIATNIALPTSNMLAGDAAGKAADTNLLTCDLATFEVGIGNGTATSNALMDTKLSAQVFYGNSSGAIGSDNLQYGQLSLSQALAASQGNVAIGIQALERLQQGESNAALGNSAGLAVIDNNSNTAIGAGALSGTACGNENTAVGCNAIGATNNAATLGNTAVGYNALAQIDGGVSNSSIGHGAGGAIILGGRNVHLGRNADSANSSSSDSVIIGNASGGDNDCVVIGGSSEGGDGAVSIGREANAGSPSVNSTTIGGLASAEDDCIAIGHSAVAVQRLGNPMLSISGVVAAALANAFVFPDNTTAVAAGLVPGDAYCVDLAAAGIPAPGAGGGPAVVAFVY